MPRRKETRRRKRCFSVDTRKRPLLPRPPTSVLPNELLLDIFEHSADADFNEDSTSDKLRTMNAISRVCRQWRFVAASLPTLWNHLRVHIAPAMNALNLCHIPKWLTYSRHLPLELILDLRLGTEDEHTFKSWPEEAPAMRKRLFLEFSRMLLAHISRLTKLTIYFSSLSLDNGIMIDDPDNDGFMDVVISSSLDAADNLKELFLINVPEIETITEVPRKFPQGATLEALHLTRFMFAPEVYLDAHSLQSLELDFSDTYRDPFTLYEVMSWICLDSLTELRIRLCNLVTEDSGKNYCLPSLRVLHLNDISEDSASSFLSLVRLPTIEELLVYGYDVVKALTEHLRSNSPNTFGSVRTLHMSADCDLEPESLDTIVRAFPAIVRLTALSCSSTGILGVLDADSVVIKNSSLPSMIWPHLLDASFAWQEENENFHDQLFRLIQRRIAANVPLRSVDFTYEEQL